MAQAMGISLKTEQRRSHTAVAGFAPWVRRAEGYRETRQIKPSGQVPVTPRRPPSLPLVCERFPDPSSFSVLRETPMVFFYDNFKQLKCYKKYLYAFCFVLTSKSSFPFPDLLTFRYSFGYIFLRVSLSSL
jgi:hypothetical protein